MGFATEFNSVCKFKHQRELDDLLEYGTCKMTKTGFRIFPTGQKTIAYSPENKAIAIVRILVSIAEIDFKGQEVTGVEMELVRLLTELESEVETTLAYEMFFRDQEAKQA
ncbi:MAG: hypothetical protein H7X86_05060 [Gorillibacterium sp.]|nr:hypothetical protein [Gorillibacterium sp.]